MKSYNLYDEFAEYCRKAKEDNKCPFYNNLRNNNGSYSLLTNKTIEDIQQESPLEVNEVVDVCKDNEVCPYEISLMMAKKAKVIIADYYYIFSPSIMNRFFNKTELELEECIIIVDEAHNLPNRVKDLFSVRLTSVMILCWRTLNMEKLRGAEKWR